MRDVSILNGGHDVSQPGDPLLIRPVRPLEIDPALGRLFGRGDRPASGAGIDHFKRYAAARQIRLDRLLLAERSGRVVWTVLPIVSPGRTALLMVPPLLPPRDDAAAIALVNTACTRVAGEGAHLAQALLDPTDRAVRQMLAGQRFVQMAELIYLQVVPPRTIPPPLPQGWTLHPYRPALHERFGQAILESYRDSLDCPAMSGLREIDDIIAGHQAAGEFDPDLWFMLCEQEVPRGVLLMSRLVHGEGVELVYIGIAPAARHRGVGRLLIQQAFAVVTAEPRHRLTLAVDSANVPALRLYYGHGMQRIGSKVAMMRDLRSAPSKST